MPVERAPSHVAVDRLMRDLEDDVRRARRVRLLARGGASDYDNAKIYEQVDRVLRQALTACDRDALILPDLLSGDDDWTLAPHVEITSHRPLIGPVLVFFKRRVLLPLTRWLYEYTQENFRRQQQINRVLFACIEMLAIENAKLRQAAPPGEDAGQDARVGRPGPSGHHST